MDGHGLVDPRDVAAAITPDTVLVTIMHANNETGTVQPLRDIAVDFGALGVDLLTVVGHKM